MIQCRFSSYSDYEELQRWLRSLRDRGQISEWGDVCRYLVQEDLFFLAAFVMSDGRTAINADTGHLLYHDNFYVKWCRDIEWQIENGGGVDVSARGVGKSTLRTKAANIQRILKYPSSTGLIASFLRKAAKKHYRTIKEELEQNELLKVWFDDILYPDPKASAKGGEASWSMDEGFWVKYPGQNRKDATLEYIAFIDGTPTGGRYDWISADDVEDHKIVQSETLLGKLHQAYDATIMLATPVAVPKVVIMLTNTMYSDAGLVARKVMVHEGKDQDKRKVRRFQAERLSVPGPGPMGGTPQYPFSEERLRWYWQEMRDKREYAVQLCCSFLAGEERTFDQNGIIWYDQPPAQQAKGKNIYICVDPSAGITDPTAIWVWGLGQDKKAYWLDASLKRLDPALPEFGDEIVLMATKWGAIGARVVEIRMENFGQATFDALLKKHLDDRHLYYDIITCADNRTTGKFDTGKRDREWERWAIPFHQGEILFPRSVKQGGSGILSPDEEGTMRDLVDYFIDFELTQFPRCVTDNLLDAGSLLWEPEDKAGRLQYPVGSYVHYSGMAGRVRRHGRGERQRSWMSAG